ncbi:hypothetical protein M422DRAFT_245530 [Sphaerobolus stellatus SS14]|nr:hypothetical protein M422DRAFT_245530 [Sphaerobolus stellatus SS14]
MFAQQTLDPYPNFFLDPEGNTFAHLLRSITLSAPLFHKTIISLPRTWHNWSSILLLFWQVTLRHGTPPDFHPEPFRPELSPTSSTLWKRFRAGFTLNTFVDSCGQRVGGLVGDNGRLVEDICAYSHSA